MATDNYRGGWLAAEFLARTLAAEGKCEPKLILLRYAVGSESTDARERGFLDYFDPAVTDKPRNGPLPNVMWLSNNQYAGSTMDSAARVAGPLIQRFRDKVDAIFASNESATTGVLNQLRSQQLNFGNSANERRIHLMGFDSSQPLLQAIADGDVDGSIIQDPYKMGYLGVDTILRYLHGEDVNDGRKKLIRSTGEYLVTRDNVDSIETIKRFDPAAQLRRDMKKELAAEGPE